MKQHITILKADSSDVFQDLVDDFIKNVKGIVKSYQEEMVSIDGNTKWTAIIKWRKK